RAGAVRVGDRDVLERDRPGRGYAVVLGCAGSFRHRRLRFLLRELGEHLAVPGDLVLLGVGGPVGQAHQVVHHRGGLVGGLGVAVHQLGELADQVVGQLGGDCHTTVRDHLGVGEDHYVLGDLGGLLGHRGAGVPVGEADLGVPVVDGEHGIVVAADRDLLDAARVHALLLHAHDRVLVAGRRGGRLQRHAGAGADGGQRLQTGWSLPGGHIGALGAVAVEQILVGRLVGGGDRFVGAVRVRVV